MTLFSCYFVFCIPGEELVYLDPHTTQLSCNLDDEEEKVAGDESYHCRYACRMNMSRLDPSIAVVSTIHILV